MVNEKLPPLLVVRLGTRFRSAMTRGSNSNREVTGNCEEEDVMMLYNC
jgi:hypothetical protein